MTTLQPDVPIDRILDSIVAVMRMVSFRQTHAPTTDEFFQHVAANTNLRAAYNNEEIARGIAYPSAPLTDEEKEK